MINEVNELLSVVAIDLVFDTFILSPLNSGCDSRSSRVAMATISSSSSAIISPSFTGLAYLLRVEKILLDFFIPSVEVLWPISITLIVSLANAGFFFNASLMPSTRC